MQYAVMKWHFNTAVRFGNNKGQLADSGYIMHSDTLFSALCQEALKLGGEEELTKLYTLCKAGKLLFSDTMPYIDETYFLPKPLMHIERAEQESSSVLKKAHKKLKYIPSDQYEAYIQSLAGKAEFDVHAVNNLMNDFAHQDNRIMAGVTGNEDTKPFYVNTWTFAPSAGLYVIVGFENDDDLYWLETIMRHLGLSGVGGKKNSGLGKFDVDDVIFLDDAYSGGLEALQTLLAAEGTWQMTLSCALPTNEELTNALDGAAYQILKRSGFVHSAGYADEQRKHNNLYVLSAGSCFKHKFAGDIYDIANGGKHAVYRYAKPLFLGVNV